MRDLLYDLVEEFREEPIIAVALGVIYSSNLCDPRLVSEQRRRQRDRRGDWATRNTRVSRISCREVRHVVLRRDPECAYVRRCGFPRKEKLAQRPIKNVVVEGRRVLDAPFLFIFIISFRGKIEHAKVIRIRCLCPANDKNWEFIKRRELRASIDCYMQHVFF